MSLNIAALRPERLADTTLFQRLQKTPPGMAVSGSIATLCGEASDRMKAVPALHPQFTLHDAAHLLRVTELMAMVLGRTLEELNPIEIALLILAAHFHDIGMVPEAAEWNAIESSKDFKLHRDTWAVEHPNLGELEAQLSSGILSSKRVVELALQRAELELAMRSDFVRRTHGQRAADVIRGRYAVDPRLTSVSHNFADVLAELCLSHVRDPGDLSRLEPDRLVGVQPVNVRYLAVVLRLADILDFDRERTPDDLFRTIHFTSDVSLREWEKHRGVNGWTIGPDQIRFEMEFEHPIYERAARQFLDWIDAELAASHDLVRSLPAAFASYQLHLPLRVNPSRVGPKNHAYVYHDLEFSLSRDEIVKLLMTEKLYGSPDLCVRELLQNSLDALRYRSALFRLEDLEWKSGAVSFEHGVDADGTEFLRCADNGVGMDEAVILKFLTKVGRSFYRSPFFEQERQRFRDRGIDFDPCSRFGIGFMSCFMLGDRIRIETRRTYGPNTAPGKPWIVEINGLSSILVLKPGPESQQVGTTVTVSLREKAGPFQLVATLDRYTLAAEYPVKGQCTVPGKESQIPIPAGIRRPITFLESLGIRQLVRLERDFSELDESGLYTGRLAESFLADETGCLVLSNREARWEVPTELRKYVPLGEVRWGLEQEIRECQPLPETWLLHIDDHHPRVVMANAKTTRVNSMANEDRICADGIWVGDGAFFSQSGVVRPAFTLNTRGQRKPALTPDRKLVRSGATWEAIVQLNAEATRSIWHEIVSYLPDKLSYDTFWKLAKLHSAPVEDLPKGLIWDKLAIPIDAGQEVEFRRIRDIGTAFYRVVPNDPRGPQLTVEASRVMDVGKSMILTFSQLTATDGNLRLVIAAPHDPNGFCRLPNVPGSTVVRFEAALESALLAYYGYYLCNLDHPLIRYFLQCKDEDHGALSEFLRVLGAADPVNPKPAGRRLEYRQKAGQLFSQIPWRERDPALLPPYRIFIDGGTWTAVTEADFEEWAKIVVPKKTDGIN
jgi:hypothetical protein